MNAAIAGVGWVTPLGSDVSRVGHALLERRNAALQTLGHPVSGREYPVRLVPPDAVAGVERLPRLRRSSRISHFAVAAALAALRDAGLEMSATVADGTALVFAVSDGGVIYTRRFYEQIATEGASSASPLLFPETVYNAPASHLAAVLGVEGAVYSIVGDQSAGFAALHLGAQLLFTDTCERVIVVGCEECDWTVCEAYRSWHRAFAPLSEGAGAVVIERAGSQASIELATAAGCPFFKSIEAAAALQRVLQVLPRNADAVLASRFPGNPEGMAIEECLGDAPGASALWQTVFAVALVREHARRRVLAWNVGANHQAGAAFIAARGELQTA